MNISAPQGLARSGGSELARASITTPTSIKRRILIVEDESDLARVVKRHVEEIGCEVVVAPTGERALDAAARTEFGLPMAET